LCVRLMLHGYPTRRSSDLGVPCVSFNGIKPGETFEYRFTINQNGTYWYHSHSKLQEQLGRYGPLIVDPIDEDPVEYDREYPVVRSEEHTSELQSRFDLVSR